MGRVQQSLTFSDAGTVIQSKLDGIGPLFRSFADGIAWLNFDFGSLWDPVIASHASSFGHCGEDATLLLTTLYSVLAVNVSEKHSCCSSWLL